MTENENVTKRKEISSAMREVGVRLDSNLMSKCLSLCSTLHVDASQLAESWEAYSLNKAITSLDETTFAPFRHSLLKDLENDRKSDLHTDNYDPNSAITTVPAMMKRSRDESFMTPNKKQSLSEESEDKQDKAQRRVSLSPGHDVSLQNAFMYEKRSGVGTTVVSFNPKDLSEIESSDLHRCVSIKPFGQHNIQTNFRYMFHTLEQRAKALDDHMLNLQAAFEDQEDIQNYENIGVPKQEQVSVIGRVCNEAHKGRLNSTSIMLEAPRNQNGTRVHLRLDAMKDSYSLFPGQIIKVEGINTSGRSMVATSIKEGCPLPHQKTKAKDLLKFHHLGKANGRPIQIMSASGPFTTSNDLEYGPLFDFMMGIVKSSKPDVIILTGPFVDLRQPLLQKGRIHIPVGGNPMPVSYETLFVEKITAQLDALYADEPDLITQIVLVPSIDDAISEPVYPQPPISDRIPDGRQTNLPSSEGMELGSLFLHHVDNVGTHPQRIHCVSNPCTITINEVVIGITSIDTLLHLSSDETNSKLMGNRMSRIAQHLIQQRSFYPLFPPPLVGDANLDLLKMNNWNFPCTPDILIVPSKLATFCKNVLDCVVINPGHISKGMTGGTYAIMNIHPIDRGILEGQNGDVEMEHNVHERIRVDITKV